jgi:hypothetical protein
MAEAKKEPLEEVSNKDLVNRLGKALAGDKSAGDVSELQQEIYFRLYGKSLLPAKDKSPTDPDLAFESADLAE